MAERVGSGLLRWSDDYALYTPIIGATLGATILFFGIGVVAMAKQIMPHEVAIQQRHIGMSDPVDRQTLAAQVLDTGDKAGIKRRGMLKGSLLLAGGGLGVAAIVPVLGGFIKNPWAERADSPLWVTPWAPAADGTKVRMVQIDGTPIRPSDLEAGSMATVFPGVPGGAKASDAAVMLFRVRSDSVIRIRDGQQGFQFGDYYAFSKICTHVGCPVSLYEAADRPGVVPVPPVAVQSLRRHVPGVRSRYPAAPPAAHRAGRRRVLRRIEGLHRSSRSRFLGEWQVSSVVLRTEGGNRMSRLTTPTKATAGPSVVQKSLDAADIRYHGARPLRTALNKVFPSHWSFMLGEAALYSFIVLLLSGVYLTLFFDPSMAETVYTGVYEKLRGVPMSMAYDST